MSEGESTQEHASERCPDLDAVNAVLDREAAEEVAVALRRHVASCPGCGERYGALFEVDSLAPAVAERGTAIRRPIAWQRAVLPAAAAIAVAATIVVLLRPRADRVPEVARSAAPRASSTASPPRMVASRLVETEIVVDGAGVRSSIRDVGHTESSFQIESSRGEITSRVWSSRSSVEESR